MTTDILKILSDYENSPLQRAAKVDELVKRTYGQFLQSIYNKHENFRLRKEIADFSKAMGIDLQTKFEPVVVTRKHILKIYSDKRKSGRFIVRNCECCKKQFDARLDEAKRGNARFCSLKCFYQSRKEVAA